MDYMAQSTNFFDMLISIIFIILFTLRQMGNVPDGAETHVERRNSGRTELYMGLWSVAAVLLWGRRMCVLTVFIGLYFYYFSFHCRVHYSSVALETT